MADLDELKDDELDADNETDTTEVGGDFGGEVVTINAEVDTVAVDTNRGDIIITLEGGGTQVVTPAGEKDENGGDKGVMVVDASGDTWTISKGGKVTRGDSLTSDETIDSLDTNLNFYKEEGLIVAVLEGFQKDINAWLEVNGKGPLTDIEMDFSESLPNCMPESLETLEAVSGYLDEVMADKPNRIPIIIEKLQEKKADWNTIQQIASNLGEIDVSPVTGLETGPWENANDILCPYVLEAAEEAFTKIYIIINGKKFADGSKVVLKKEYKKEVMITLTNGNTAINQGIDWTIGQTASTSSEVNFDLSEISKTADGTVIEANWNGKSVTISLVIANVYLLRSFKMAQTANVYPIIEPSGLEGYITFESSDTEILTLSGEYPILHLIGQRPGKVQLIAKSAAVIFDQEEIEVIKEPTIQFAPPVVSDVNFDNIGFESINFDYIAFTEVQDGFRLNGLCSPEKISISKPEFYYLKGNEWYPYITKISGEYFKDYRLVEGQKEISNSNASNYCEQLISLKIIPKLNHERENGLPNHYWNYATRLLQAKKPLWYMKEAVKKHEEVHEVNVKKAYYHGLQDSLISIVQKGFVVSDQPRKEFSEILDDGFIIQEFLISEIETDIALAWKSLAIQYSKNDHDPGGLAEKAEYSVINPKIVEICEKALTNKWEPCDPDVCEKGVPSGGEIPQIIDISDENNQVVYNLEEYGTISMGNRKEIKIKFRLQNSMIFASQLEWNFMFADKVIRGVEEITFNNSQFTDTIEQIELIYQGDHYYFTIKK